MKRPGLSQEDIDTRQPWTPTPPPATLLVYSQLPVTQPVDCTSTQVASRLSWSNKMELALLDTLVVREDRDEVIKNGIRLQAWGPVITAVKMYTPVNKQQLLTPKRLKSRFDDLKRLWRAWVAIVALSGWSVDEDTGLPKADPEIMANYFLTHKVARYFMTRPLPHQTQLYALCQGKTATGRRALETGSHLARRRVTQAIEDDTSTDDGDPSVRVAETTVRVVETSLTGNSSQCTPDIVVADSNFLADAVLTTQERRRMNAENITALERELKRGNDLMAERVANMNPIRTAVALLNELVAKDWDDLDLVAQFVVCNKLAESDGHSWLFIESSMARKRTIIDAWIADRGN
jgi:hypothetical protein